MKIITDQHGNKKYQFEANEDDARMIFERSILPPNLSEVMTAVFEAYARQKAEAQDTWERMRKAIGEIDPGANPQALSYDWMSRSIVPQKDVPNERAKEEGQK